MKDTLSPADANKRELKVLTGMGERRKAWAEAREFPAQTTSRAPVTLPKLKWGRDG